MFRKLSSNPGDDVEADLRVNSGAVDAQLEWTGRGDLVQKKKPGREDLDAFETAYNAACGSIARDELGQGEVLLKRAKDLCNSVEDMSEEEKRAELLPITVQQVYVLLRLGRTEEAESLAWDIQSGNITDVITRHISRINSVASERDINSFLAQRLVASDLDSLKPDYPFEYQTAILKRNQYASGECSVTFFVKIEIGHVSPVLL